MFKSFNNNDNKEKGLKGVEYPQGDITFDIDRQLARVTYKMGQ